jgi:hypothetical protein
MEKQQLETMLFIEKSYHSKSSIKSHPKRRVIADCLNKVCFFLEYLKTEQFVFLIVNR